MKLKRFMIAKSHNEHGLSVSSYFPSSRGAVWHWSVFALWSDPG